MPGTALCLSGGGFRALHWHLGALGELNRRGLLAQIDTISGVSAGALCAAWIGLHWQRLQFDSAGVATNLDAEVIAPLRGFAQNRIGIPTALMSMGAPLGWACGRLGDDMNRLLFRGAKLGDITPAPQVVMSSVELTTADPVRFTHSGGWHTRLGPFDAPHAPVVTAVVASCAFPPFFAPAIVPVTREAWREASDPPAKLYLGDGVLEDNSGLEAVWGSHDRLLISDASLPCKLATPIRPVWHSILLHTQRVQFFHARQSRLARLREQFTAGLKSGAYWGLSGDCFGGCGGTGPLASVPVMATGDGAGATGANSPNPGAEVQALWRIAANFVRLRPEVQQSLEAQSETLCRRALDGMG